MAARVKINFGAPPAPGYYLTFWDRGGNRWVFLHKVFRERQYDGALIFLDHFGGGRTHDLIAKLGDYVGWLPLDKAQEAAEYIRDRTEQDKLRRSKGPG